MEASDEQLTHKRLERVRHNVAEFDPVHKTRDKGGLALRLAKRELRVLVFPELIVDLEGQVQVQTADRSREGVRENKGRGTREKPRVR